MAPAMTPASLERRYVECFNGICRERNRWSSVGRWIVLGAVLLFLLVTLFLCSCLARRRRRRGAQPMYGTGWMAPNGKHGGDNQAPGNYQPGYPQTGYYGQQSYPPAPPAYGQPQQPQYTGTTGTSFNPNDGYYGDPSQHQHQHQQQYGVQQPPNAYQPETTTYSPPAGPPPGK